MLKLNHYMAFAAVMTALLPGVYSASARAKSDQPIHIVVPYAGGGTIDAIVRMVAEKMRDELGQPVVVDNKPGANGIVGSSYVAQAKPDGLTLLAGGTGPVSLNVLLRKNLAYSIKSFDPVAMLFDGPLSITVPSKIGIESVKGLTDFAKKSGKLLRYGTLGPGSVTHLFGLMLEQNLGVGMVDVAYRNNPSSLVDLIGGQAELSFATPIALAEHVKSGDVKILALTTEKRHPQFPDIPTVTELGHPSLIASFWTALLAPAGTPKAQISRISAAAVKAMQSPDINDVLVKQGLTPQPGGLKFWPSRLTTT